MKHIDFAGVAMFLMLTVILSVGITRCSQSDDYVNCLKAKQANNTVECKQP